jgi:hypothetical protein
MFEVLKLQTHVDIGCEMVSLRPFVPDLMWCQIFGHTQQGSVSSSVCGYAGESDHVYNNCPKHRRCELQRELPVSPQELSERSGRERNSKEGLIFL